MRAGGSGALALVALLVLPSNGCRPTPAAAEVRGADTFLVAAGDTLKATQFFKVTGSPDSVRYLFTVPGAPSLALVKVAPANGITQSLGPALLIPSPPLTDGQMVTVTACPTAYKPGHAPVTAPCSQKSYTKPSTPPTVTGDSLTVIGMDLYPRGTLALTRASGACIRAYTVGPANSGWEKTWDVAAQDWKAVCKGANGLPMIAHQCAAMVMGDSVRVLSAQWTTRPWCAKYTAQVPRRYVPPPGLMTKRQIAAERAVVQFSARQTNGAPMAGFIFDEPFGMTVVRDTVTADAAVPEYQFRFMLSRSPPGRGAFASPDSTIVLMQKFYASNGAPIAGRVATFAVTSGGGQVATLPDPASRWKHYGLERS